MPYNGIFPRWLRAALVRGSEPQRGRCAQLPLPPDRDDGARTGVDSWLDDAPPPALLPVAVSDAGGAGGTGVDNWLDGGDCELLRLE